MDQLNIHSPASFYEAFEPAEAKRLTDKLEIHYTPKHGSWLNIAEIELSALSRQCLDRRIADTEILKREVEAWKASRNDAKTRVRWRFTTANARIKLHRLYPSIKPLRASRSWTWCSAMTNAASAPSTPPPTSQPSSIWLTT